MWSDLFVQHLPIFSRFETRRTTRFYKLTLCSVVFKPDPGKSALSQMTCVGLARLCLTGPRLHADCQDCSTV